MKILHIPVKKEDGDVRLDRLIRRYYPSMKQGMIQKLCRTGQIRVDGKRAQASIHLGEGNVIRVPVATDKEYEMEADQHFSKMDPAFLKEMKQWIIYEDDALFVFNKPSGIAVQGGSKITRHIDGMLDALRGKNGYRPSLVHRLDKETSGILLVARHPDAAAKLAASFRARTAKKTYWAVTVHRPSLLQGRITFPLVKVERPGESHVIIAENMDGKAQKAVTEYEVREYVARKLAWVEFHPLTGRMHQLRVHSAAIGCPILGDRKYNQEPALDGFADQLHLHARSLTIPYPQGGTLEIDAELSSHMKETFRLLGFTLPSGNKVTLHKRR